MNTNDPRLELIRRCRDGEASTEELAQLDSNLREDADFRQAYVRYINLDVASSAECLAAMASGHGRGGGVGDRVVQRLGGLRVCGSAWRGKENGAGGV
jgi:hypothetical protein